MKDERIDSKDDQTYSKLFSMLHSLRSQHRVILDFFLIKDIFFAVSKVS